MSKRDLICIDLPSSPAPEMGIILVTGATGYIGGRLVPELIARGYRVRVMVREIFPEYYKRWEGAEVVFGDALNYESLLKAMEGVHTAYYLMHTMMFGGEKHAAIDIQAAINFSRAADHESLARVIYLGGVGDIHKPFTSRPGHRLEVENELRRGQTPTTILLATVIIGSGSAFYEILRNLVDGVELLLLPRWTRKQFQIISVRDVIKYLVAVLETPETTGKAFHLGREELVTLETLLRFLSAHLSKRRLFVPLPVSWIGLFTYIANLITAVPGPIIWCQFARIRNGAVCANRDITKLIPIELMDFRQALVRAIARYQEDGVDTRWSDAYPPSHFLHQKLEEMPLPPLYGCSYSLVSAKGDESLFRSVCKLGGEHGWFNSNLLWRVRGWMDRLLMGVGTIRGRRSANELRVNDVVDFFRVEDLVDNRRLLLRVEMKIPAVAWLEFRISPETDNNRLAISAHYQPRGLFGKIYWYVFLPFHFFIFNDLIRQIERRA